MTEPIPLSAKATLKADYVSESKKVKIGLYVPEKGDETKDVVLLSSDFFDRPAGKKEFRNFLKRNKITAREEKIIEVERAIAVDIQAEIKRNAETLKTPEVVSSLSNLSNLKSLTNLTNLSKENIELIRQPDISYQNLNQGVFGDCFYVGKLVRYGRGLTEAVITSKKEVFVNKAYKIKGETVGVNEITALLGLAYTSDLEETKNRWSSEGITSWLDSAQPVKQQMLFETIRQLFEQYMDLQAPAEYDILACFVVGTYCFELFETFPILFLTALKDSGKSKLMKLVRLLSFNGEPASSITEAAFFRSIEGTKGNLCIDEYELIDTDRKKLCDQLLNAGIEKGARVKRVEKINNRFVTRSYDVYCPKVVANISGLPESTLSRCIVFRLLRTTNKKGNLRPRENGKEWRPIRDACFAFVLENWQAIQEIYDAHLSENILNRNEDIWRPIFAMAKFFGEDVYERVLEYAKESIKENKVDVFSSDWDFQLLQVLRDNVSSGGWYKVKQIRGWLSERLSIENPPRETWVGRQLKAHKFRQRCNPDSEYLLSPEEIDDRFQRRYGELDLTEDDPEGTKVTKETKVTKALNLYTLSNKHSLTLFLKTIASGLSDPQRVFKAILSSPKCKYGLTPDEFQELMQHAFDKELIEHFSGGIRLTSKGESTLQEEEGTE